MIISTMIMFTAVSRAADLSGVYADGGTMVATDPGPLPVEPSLFALLSLEFDARVAGVLRDQTSHVAIKHEGGRLEIEVYDTDGESSWSGRWKEGEGYVQRGSRVILRFRAARPASDEFVLVLEPVTPHGLLQVSVQRVTPTLLGPVSRSLGTYLFHRMP